jgi:penicillin-binding protein 2
MPFLGSKRPLERTPLPWARQSVGGRAPAPLTLHTGRADVRATSLGERFRTIVVLLLISFGVLIGRLVQLQLIEGKGYQRRARIATVDELYIPHIRGIVRDRHGQLLVDNRPSFNVLVTPRAIMKAPDPETGNLPAVIGAHLVRLCDLLELSSEERAELIRRVTQVKGADRTRPIIARRDVSRDVVAAIETVRHELPGVQLVATPHRYYPHGALGAHALGYLNEISAKELTARRSEGYRPRDLIGRFGLERLWEGYLRGRDGFERVLVDARRRRKPEPEQASFFGKGGGGVRKQDPEPGRNLITTLDLGLMKIAEKAMKRYPAGALVAVEPSTGRVLAMVSKPAFDPNLLAGRLSYVDERRLLDDPLHPLTDKTIREIYYPGSTFKPFTALAGLEDKVIDPKEKYFCTAWYRFGRRVFHCLKVHKDVVLHEALVESCNIYFYKTAEAIGIDRMAKVAHGFGLGEASGLGLNGESAGVVPDREWYKQNGFSFRVGFSLNAALGQGNTKVTPLQVAMAYAAIGNGGRLYLPQLVSRVEGSDGRVLEEFSPQLRRQVPVQPENLERIKKALVDVVHDKHGTGHKAFVALPEGTPLPDGVHIAGKTGTAQIDRISHEARGNNAWFAGFAPAEKPTIAVAVVLENAGAGSREAAPVALNVIKAYLTGQHLPKTERAASGTPTGAGTGAGTGPEAAGAAGGE